MPETDSAVNAAPLLELRGLSKTFRPKGKRLGRGAQVRAVDDVSFSIPNGSILGLVGESGSGKTTIGRMVVGLETPTDGEVVVDDGETRSTRKSGLRRNVQMVFQNPRGSLNPRRTVRSALLDGVRIAGVRGKAKQSIALREILEQVGLSSAILERFPSALSSGQCQRISIARALAVQPALVVADEAVAALDVSVQAQVLNLLSDLRSNLGLSILFISHDLRAVNYLCDRVAVLYRGRLVEIAATESIIKRPLHPYTRLLLESVPGVEKTQASVDAEPANVAAPSTGCNFVGRCPLWASLGQPARCLEERPELRSIGDASAACHFAEESS